MDDNRFEDRRHALKDLVATMGRGGIARIARETGIDASYLSRCLYPPGKPGRKNMGDDTVSALDKHFPNWRYQQAPHIAKVMNSDEAAYSLKEILEIASELNETDRQKLIGLATYLKNEEGNAQC